MTIYNKLLSELQANYRSSDIDSITYANFYEEKPLADLITFNWKKLLNNPPINSSQQTYNELQQVITVSNNRSKENEEFVFKIDQNANAILYEYLSINKINFPSKQFHVMYDICKPIVANIKFLFNRPRPYQIAKVYGSEINVLQTFTHQTPSYPSGHVFYTSLAANFIIDKYPKLKNIMNQIIDLTGQARTMQGVHYLSDNIGGKQLANILYKKLKEVL